MTKRNTNPQPPSDLNAAALEEWQRVAKLLSAQASLDKLDRAVLLVYCEAWARWREAEREVLDTGGEIVQSPTGLPISNPWRAVANASAKQMTAAARELGLTPAARKRLQIESSNPKKSGGLAVLKIKGAT